MRCDQRSVDTSAYAMHSALKRQDLQLWNVLARLLISPSARSPLACATATVEVSLTEYKLFCGVDALFMFFCTETH